MLININIGACEGKSRLLRRGKGKAAEYLMLSNFALFGPHAVTVDLGNGTSN